MPSFFVAVKLAPLSFVGVTSRGGVDDGAIGGDGAVGDGAAAAAAAAGEEEDAVLGTTRGKWTRSFLLVGPWCGVICVPGAIAEKKA